MHDAIDIPTDGRTGSPDTTAIQKIERNRTSYTAPRPPKDTEGDDSNH